ncbi:MAG TPA: SIR2 family protein, partial [Longimicrobium sp.]|nr:SIR2 family protein [Longimicrobium sp.]
MAATLFVGNGINRVGTRGLSWERLVGELALILNVNAPTTAVAERAFTLFFDSLTLEARNHGYRRSKEVKAIVAREVAKLEPGVYHRALMELGAAHVLTTNYDFTLEQVLSVPLRKPASEVSDKYNLFRRRIVNEKTVWHLHGTVDQPESLVLGFDHYAGTVERMRQYIKRGYHAMRSP